MSVIKPAAAIVLGSAIAAATAGGARASYLFTTVDYPGAAGASTLTGISDSGTMVGYADVSGTTISFADSGGNFYSYSAPSGSQSLVTISTYILGISSNGQYLTGYYDVGTSPNNFSAQYGFVLSGFSLSGGQVTGGTFTSLTGPTLSGNAGAALLTPIGINDSGQVAGWYEALTNGLLSGSSGFSYSASTGYTTVNDPNVTEATALGGINDAGDVVGEYFIGGAIAVPFVLSGGTFTDLTGLANVAGGWSADGINNAGQIVLCSAGPTGGEGAVTDQSGGSPTYLNDPNAPSTSQPSGYTCANGINDLGTIVGNTGESLLGPDGFVATQEVPEPATGMLLVGGMACLAFAARPTRRPLAAPSGEFEA